MVQEKVSVKKRVKELFEKEGKKEISFQKVEKRQKGSKKKKTRQIQKEKKVMIVRKQIDAKYNVFKR